MSLCLSHILRSLWHLDCLSFLSVTHQPFSSSLQNLRNEMSRSFELLLPVHALNTAHKPILALKWALHDLFISDLYSQGNAYHGFQVPSSGANTATHRAWVTLFLFSYTQDIFS